MNPKITLTVEKTVGTYHSNAMTAWVEKYIIDKRIYYRACARELQNFEGKHEGIVIVSFTTFFLCFL